MLPEPYRRKRPALNALACAFALMASAEAAQADTLANTLDATASGASLSVSASDWLAISFQTGDVAYAGTGLLASLALSNVSGTPQLSLYSSYGDSYGSDLIPSSALATFSLSASDDDSTDFTLASVSLSAHTTYWLVLSSPGSADWSWSADGSYDGVLASSDDAGDTWFTEGSLYPVRFAVSTVAVPEPSSAALMLVGMTTLAGVARRRFR
ncbi:choice-of-anchor R domain-containing protein [Methyloversatilis thermotolerans]|uniref:choice-of-anchor R domain-containing protein n=1 Tax=Methyloversatilis thermotolerans TaxID=1346290 RepID=UPI0003613BE9|nr:choice-of-anchor R domain-containing protein [Methyloversatilis thermotolerans]